MKILFAIATLDVGGSEVLALNLAVRLKERGHDLVIFNTNEKKVNKPFAEKYKALGLPIYSIKDWSLAYGIASKANTLFTYFGYKNHIADRLKVKFVSALIKKHKIDVVCSHAPTAGVICKEAVQDQQTPLFMVEHGRYSHFIAEGRPRFLKPLQAATEIITVSDFCKTQIRSYVGASKSITTIYNGVEVKPQHLRNEVRQELGIGEYEIAFGLVARGIKKKGWEPAINAFLKAGEETADKMHLILVGGSKYVDELKLKYQQHRQIHFVGKVANPVRFIEAMDVGLMLSMYKTEALSLSAIEYLTLGKPVIATNVGGVPEVIQFQGTSFGSLIDLDKDDQVDEWKLKTEMLRFIKREKDLFLDPEQVTLSLQRFSFDACTQAYESLFQATVPTNKGPHKALNNHPPSSVQQKEGAEEHVNAPSA